MQPLGVKFKISDEHPRLFHMGVPPPGLIVHSSINKVAGRSMLSISIIDETLQSLWKQELQRTKILISIFISILEGSICQCFQVSHSGSISADGDELLTRMPIWLDICLRVLQIHWKEWYWIRVTVLRDVNSTKKIIRNWQPVVQIIHKLQAMFNYILKWESVSFTFLLFISVAVGNSRVSKGVTAGFLK